MSFRYNASRTAPAMRSLDGFSLRDDVAGSDEMGRREQDTVDREVETSRREQIESEGRD